MDGSIAISDGLVHFTSANGSPFALDPIDTLEKIDELALKHKDAIDFAAERELAAWIAEKAKVQLTPTQADQVRRAVILEYRRAQKVFTDALGSLDSTAATPSN